MTVLIIQGNKNQYTFANAIIAANNKCLEIFGESLSCIYIIHSNESKQELRSNTDWIDKLSEYKIQEEIFVEKIIEITNQEDSIEKFVNYFESIFKGLSNPENLIVDLSNGTTLQKNVFSIAAYILDIKEQYLIDISILSSLTKDRGFLSKDILAKSYIPAPDCTYLDNIAYLNITEIIRYKRIIDNQCKKYMEIDGEYSDERFFQDNLYHSIKLKLKADITKNDNAVYRISASSIGASIDEIISIICKKIGVIDNSKKSRTLGYKINLLEPKVKEKMMPDFDFEFFTLFNKLMLYLRNSTTHKERLLTDVEKFKAELSVKLAFPFMEFYTDIIYPKILSNKTDALNINIDRVEVLNNSDLNKSREYYYGLDGDNTGLELEKIFLTSNDDQCQLKKLSNSVQKAMKEIEKEVKKRTQRQDSIIFSGGDSILFKGFLKEDDLKEIQKTYEKNTSGLTCSIGYGCSLTETYLALKIAKTQPGKNSIFGIQFTDKENAQ